MMEIVPKQFMGRVQNTFLFAGTLLQLVLAYAVGAAAHRIGLTVGFVIVGSVYLAAGLCSIWPAVKPVPAQAEASTAD